MRGFWSAATVVQVCVAGFQISEGSEPLRSAWSTSCEPPIAMTCPSARTTRLCWYRPYDIGAVEAHVGVAAFMSMTAVAPPVGDDQAEPPPLTRNLPGRYIAYEPNSTGLLGSTVSVCALGSSRRTWPPSGSKTASWPPGSRKVIG